MVLELRMAVPSSGMVTEGGHKGGFGGLLAIPFVIWCCLRSCARLVKVH